jgi:hypothetical protein
VEKKLLCNFLTITMYVPASIYNMRKRTTFELTPPFLLENYGRIYQHVFFFKTRDFIIFSALKTTETKRTQRKMTNLCVLV